MEKIPCHNVAANYVTNADEYSLGGKKKARGNGGECDEAREGDAGYYNLYYCEGLPKGAPTQQ